MASIEEIKKRFELAPELPSGLRNKIDISHNAKVGMMAGSVAGGKDGRGYYQVQVQGKRYITTHIIAMLANLPRWKELRINMKAGDYSLVVDHIDMNQKNNAPENLRIISNRENLLAARSKQNRSSSQYRGVSWHTKSQKFRAMISCPDTGMNIHLGYFACEKEAHQVYLEKAKELYPSDNNSIENL